MIILYHGVLHLLVTSCALVVAVPSTNATEWKDGASFRNSRNETNEASTSVSAAKSVAEIVKSHRRAPSFDAAESSPWVRMYNSPPGTKDSFYKYETRGNTSAHTSGEAWETFLDDGSDETDLPIDRSDVKVKDILRVKPKGKEAPQNEIAKSKSTTETITTPISSSTKSPVETTKYPPTNYDNKKNGYVAWSSKNKASNSETSADQTASFENKNSEPAEQEMVPKDGTHWKVIGDGGEEGWQVVDDKGDVEWKIEYDDGEWRVISTGDVPADTEWMDPEYAWGSAEASLADDREYNSWPADDYRASNWAGQEAVSQGTNNGSWLQKENSEQDKKDERLNSGLKTDEPVYSPINSIKKLQFGARRKTPTANSNVQQRPNEEISEESSDSAAEEKPQNDQVLLVQKAWVPDSSLAKNGQKWVQGYGSKTWEGDDTGWNAETGGETWVTTSKAFAQDPWVPKVPGAKNPPQKNTKEESNTSTQDNSVRAWGTGYGSKTWKGNEWNSNVVWKTSGYNSGLPWDVDNSTWKFPEQNKENKKPEVWSQPIPNKVEFTGGKITPSPTPLPKRSDGIRIKWPIKMVNNKNGYPKLPPSRRTESESWADNDNVGGIVWKINGDDEVAIPDEEPSKPIDEDNGWKTGGWRISNSGEEQKTTVSPWKSKAPPKGSNLLGLTWKAGGDNPLDSAAINWNQGQWPNAKIEPTWIFQGCKMTLKCGTNVEVNNDNDDDTIIPDTSDDDMMMPTTTTAPPPVDIGNLWPVRPSKGKSWKPPTKSWRPPTWKKPAPSPTPPPPPPPPETESPTMKPSTAPPIKWKKPMPPSKWRQPPSTIIWTETTPELPEMSWKPPPPPMKWKQGPRPTKSWKPPPTKSWRPPKVPKTWKPSIATPAPDMWPTTKPDCKETTDATQPPTEPEDDDDMMEPPQIIIITKLPKKPAPAGDDKKDRDDAKRKPPIGPWSFPPRKYVPKSSSNRKDKNTPSNSKGQSNRPPKNNYKYPSRVKGWPKSISSPNLSWSNNAMRRWTTRLPQNLSAWKSKYSKSRTWRQMLKKWIMGGK